MKKVLQGATALAAVMMAGPAFATEGWYGKVDAGYGFDGTLETDTVTSFGGNAGLDADWMEDIGIGYGFSNGIRLEGEIAHRYNGIEGGPTFQDGGNTQAYTAMLNAIFDFNKDGVVQPYFGLGVGLRTDDGSGEDGVRPRQVGRRPEARPVEPHRPHRFSDPQMPGLRQQSRRDLRSQS